MAIFYFFLYLLIFLFTLWILLYIRFKYKYTYWSRKLVPFLPPEFPYGNSRLLAEEKLNFGEFGADIYRQIKQQTKQFGGFFMFQKPVLLPVDPELIKRVFTNDFNVFQDRGLFCDEVVDPLSANLVNLSGAKWKKLRTKVTPTFTSGKLKTMFKTLLDCSEELERIMEGKARTQEPVDIGDIMSRLTTDNIGSCAFGLDCNSLKDPNAEFRQYGKLLIETTFSDAKWNILAVNIPFFMRLFRIPMTNRKVSKFFFGALKETVEYREKNQVQRKDFLDLFIKLKNNEFVGDDGSKKVQEPLSFNELAAQAYVFFVAGFETSGTALTFCLYELAANQDIQNKLRDEIYEVLNKHNGEITYEALMEMAYMDKVVSEALRKYPPLPMMNRICNQRYTIPNSNVTIDKGVGCWISVLGIHRDPDYYPEPDKFDPERFSEEEKAKRHPFTYLPFGEGPRICIGMRFGLLQMKVALTKLLKNFRYTLDPKTILPVEIDNKGIMLKPKQKIWLQVSNVV